MFQLFNNKVNHNKNIIILIFLIKHMMKHNLKIPMTKQFRRPIATTHTQRYRKTI
jgi:hypothetical protein